MAVQQSLYMHFVAVNIWTLNGIELLQAPAANHKETADTMLETFGLSNIAPQVGKGFNRYVQQYLTIRIQYTPRTMTVSCSCLTPCFCIKGQKSNPSSLRRPSTSMQYYELPAPAYLRISTCPVKV